MVTGEERRFAREDGLPSNHIACTVEMTNIAEPCKYWLGEEVIVSLCEIHGPLWKCNYKSCTEVL